jgi:hypothetical protein
MKSGLLKTPSCTDGEVTLTFLEGTQPLLFCEEHGGTRGMETFRHIELNSMFFDTMDILSELQMPVLRDEALMREIQEEMRRPLQNNQTNNRNTTPSRNTPSASDSATNLIVNDPPPVSETIPDTVVNEPVIFEIKDDESLIIDIEDGLEPPSYNPLLD